MPPSISPIRTAGPDRRHTDYDTTATVLALGATPVGAKDRDLDLAYLRGRTIGVASMAEAHTLELDAVATLDPDLIIGPADTVVDADGQLWQITPTVDTFTET
jgi:ABC-type Fe3+-hydroxamate transport system substrate-binding protein